MSSGADELASVVKDFRAIAVIAYLASAAGASSSSSGSSLSNTRVTVLLLSSVFDRRAFTTSSQGAPRGEGDSRGVRGVIEGQEAMSITIRRCQKYLKNCRFCKMRSARLK